MSDFDPIEEFIALLKDNWQDGNTAFGSTPFIVDGWGENDKMDVPSVILTSNPESTLGASETGYTHVNSGTGTPISRMMGDVVAFCVAHDEMGLTEPPKYVARQMKDEVRRIINANYDEPFDPVYLIGFAGSSYVVDDTRIPIWHRYDCQLRYFYDHRP